MPNIRLRRPKRKNVNSRVPNPMIGRCRRREASRGPSPVCSTVWEKLAAQLD